MKIKSTHINRSKLLDKVQRFCNEYVRFRDMIRTEDGSLIAKCISCGEYIYLDSNGRNRDLHSGHYWREDKYSSVRFDEDNLHHQCGKCNRYLSGNLAEYEIYLRKKIGYDRMQTLEIKRNQVKVWQISELQELEIIFKEKIKKEKIRLGIK